MDLFSDELLVAWLRPYVYVMMVMVWLGDADTSFVKSALQQAARAFYVTSLRYVAVECKRATTNAQTLLLML